jgi:hypothetical protein
MIKQPDPLAQYDWDEVDHDFIDQTGASDIADQCSHLRG